jgi:hypothetical protein
MYSIESSWEESRAKVRNFSNFSETDSPPFFRFHLKMDTESVPETLENFHTLARLSGREDFIEFCSREKLQGISLGTASMKLIFRSAKNISLYRHFAYLSTGTDGGSLVCPCDNSGYCKLLCLFLCLLVLLFVGLKC